MDRFQLPTFWNTTGIGYEKGILNKTYVNGCPDEREYLLRASEKCDGFRKLGKYKYHCMPDTYKTKYVEFCAKPIILFDYCAQYNQVTNKIEMDEDRPCIHNTPQKFFSSSDLFFCDGCLPLQGTSTFFDGTTQAMEQSSKEGAVLEKAVLNCLDVRASEKCAEFPGKYDYHCMRDTDKKTLVEFCARTVVLFDHCPEYNPKTKKVQTDKATPCGGKSQRYNSSDIFFCDPARCHRLIGLGTGINPMEYIFALTAIVFVGIAVIFIVYQIYKKVKNHRKNANRRPANLLPEMV